MDFLSLSGSGIDTYALIAADEQGQAKDSVSGCSDARYGYFKSGGQWERLYILRSTVSRQRTTFEQTLAKMYGMTRDWKTVTCYSFSIR
jgi:hypothetical protein